MIELSRHIECLMLDHDCVIVPGLGGFVTQYVPARYVAEEQLFLPPYRSVGFNQQLSLNDGLLVQSYMQAYDTDYPETIKIIDDAVAQLKKELQENGEYELSGIGRLTLGIGGTYNFIPCEAGVLSPELYGLDAVNVADVKHSEIANTTKKAKEKKGKIRLHRSEKNYTITLNRELVNYVAAAVVAVFFYFIWATPISNSADNGMQTASVLYEQLFNQSTLQAAHQSEEAHPTFSTDSCGPINLMGTAPSQEQQPFAIQKPLEEGAEMLQAQQASQPSSNAQTNTAKSSTNEAKAKSNTEKEVNSNVGKYTLVLASAISEENAQAMSTRLRSEGLHEVQPYKRGRMVRVVCGHYASKEQAQQALSRLQQNNQFAEAWVLEMK